MSSSLQGLQLTSTIRDDGTLAVVVQPQTLPAPAPDEVVIEVQATPLTPLTLACSLDPLTWARLRPCRDKQAYKHRSLHPR